MDETTLTESPSVDVSSPDTGLLETTEDTSAVVETDETHTDPTGTDETVFTDDSPELAWAKSIGADPTTPEGAAKLAKIARDNMANARSKPQNIQAEINADPTIQEARLANDENPEITEMRQSMQEMQFYMANPDANTPEMKEAIIETAKQYPSLAYNFDLNTLYAITKANQLQAQQAKAVKEAEVRGRKEAKAAIARGSAAALPGGNASTPSRPTLTREAIASMSASEYESRRDEIKAAIRAGEIN